MTNTDREICLVASILESPHAEFGPVTCTALGFWTFWGAMEARIFAEPICKVIGRGKVPTRPMVRAVMDKEYRDWMDHPMFNDPRGTLPPSCWETLAAELLPNYHGIRLQRMINEAHEWCRQKPHKATDIARNLVRELGAVL